MKLTNDMKKLTAWPSETDYPIYRRRSLRLKEYDYSRSGAYFVTICTQDRACLLGKILDGQMILNDAGIIIDEEWRKLKARFPNIELDEYVIMPNHFHGIITLDPQIVGATLVVAREITNDRAGTRPAPTQEPTIGDIIGTFKSLTTDQYINGVNTDDWQPFVNRLWQRNYYEHVIRDNNDLDRVRRYICDNPAQWAEDENNPTPTVKL